MIDSLTVVVLALGAAVYLFFEPIDLPPQFSYLPRVSSQAVENNFGNFNKSVLVACITVLIVALGTVLTYLALCSPDSQHP